MAGKPKNSEKKNEKKWGTEIWGYGWTGVPLVLLERQGALGLTDHELVVLLQLMKHWWAEGSLPYPSRKSIAECMGSNQRSVQRHITRLAKDGFIERRRRKRDDGGYTSNEYSFEGLVEMLKKLAVEGKERREAEKEARSLLRKSRPARKSSPSSEGES